jgi:hypothetical protein
MARWRKAPREIDFLARKARIRQPLGLTVLKHASVFGTPCADAGHPDGFMAIGNVSLPATDGRRVGSVTIKAPAEKITDYAENLRQAIEACAQGVCDP